MLFLRLVLAVVATAFVLALFTCVWVVSQSRGVKAIGLYALFAMTLRSPAYWLLAAAIVVAAVWLCRRWVLPI
jgi:ABC-type branched-subunit amino acid transport system permease subunit